MYGGVRADLGSEAPALDEKHTDDILTFSDILGGGVRKAASEWSKVDQLLPPAAAECVRKVARGHDTMQMQGADWVVDEQISRARHGSRKAMAHFPPVFCKRASSRHGLAAG